MLLKHPDGFQSLSVVVANAGRGDVYFEDIPCVIMPVNLMLDSEPV
jgi:hypothetical protein